MVNDTNNIQCEVGIRKGSNKCTETLVLILASRVIKGKQKGRDGR